MILQIFRGLMLSLSLSPCVDMPMVKEQGVVDTPSGFGNVTVVSATLVHDVPCAALQAPSAASHCWRARLTGV